MEHLVESHLGGYYVSNSDIDFIETMCEECGDYDRVMLSFEEGKLLNELSKMFSEIKMSEEIIKRDIKMGLTKEEVYQNIRYDYEEDILLIDNLIDSEIIEQKDRNKILKRIYLSKRKQIKILKQVTKEEIDYKNNTYKLKK